ncbi:MAG: hypothetical protein A2X28_02235 [Elusimicrobia bacterium GWA2_56_46]|nr:MAG: hypothetical protein A2X28_02235 [Elusimicrobia bacterium GWA2_56_46]OGR55415.1 MAG: hypothetical protein A2X39_00730 [Elusimicrobia bacterium GWC2_56_31]HBW21878.1 hypothetical protein [Elusimicrobiota bacterium]
MINLERASENTNKVKTFAIALFAFSILCSVTLAEASMLLLAGVLVLGYYRENDPLSLFARIKGQPLFRPWMFYLAAGLLSALFALDTGKALRYLPSDLIKYACFAVLFAGLKKDGLAVMSRFYAAGAAFVAAAGIAEALWGFHINGNFDLRAGAFSNPVRFGEIMVIAATFVFSRLLASGDTETRAIWKTHVPALVLIFSAIVLSQSRGPYLGFAVMVGLMFWFGIPSRKKVARWSLAFLLIGGFISLLNPAFRDRLTGTPGVQPAGAVNYGDSSVGINIRLELWRLGFRMFSDRPILGVGPANVKSAFKRYHPAPIAYQETWGSIHNLYLHHMAERGLIGLAALLTLFGAMLALAMRNFRAERNAYTLWALTILPPYFIMNLTEISFQHIHTSFAVFMALAASTNSVSPDRSSL